LFYLSACSSCLFFREIYISFKTLIDIFASNFIHIEQYWEDTVAMVIEEVRFPRIMLAILIGGALSVSGASYQTLFKNPMVSPDILGVSAGAGFGAALAMINGANWVAYRVQLLYSVWRRSSSLLP
jgi:iron complex transport system permease protein